MKHNTVAALAVVLSFFVGSSAQADLKVSAKIGGFRVSSSSSGNHVSVSRDSDKYEFVGTDEDAEQVPGLTAEYVSRAVAERDAQVGRALDRLLSTPVVAPERDCHHHSRTRCGRSLPRDCARPGPLPEGIGVFRWLDRGKTRFRDQNGHTWYWDASFCCWVDP